MVSDRNGGEDFTAEDRARVSQGIQGWKHSPGRQQQMRGSQLLPSASLWCFSQP